MSVAATGAAVYKVTVVRFTLGYARTRERFTNKWYCKLFYNCTSETTSGTVRTPRKNSGPGPKTLKEQTFAILAKIRNP